MSAEHLAGDELGRGGTGHENGADDRVGRGDLLGHRLAGGVAGDGAADEQVVKLAQAGQRTVEDRHDGAEADGHARGLGADDTAADDHDLGRGDAGDAAEQDAAAAIRLLQRCGRGLDRQAAGDLAHRGEQRQMAVVVGDRLVGDRGDAGSHQALGLGRVGGEVEIGEEDLAGAELDPFGRLRLLDLDDHVGLGEDRGRIGCDIGTGGAVVGVAGADASTGAGFDQHPVAMSDILADGSRREADAEFARLDFPGDANEHGGSPSVRAIPSLYCKNGAYSVHSRLRNCHLRT